MEVDVSFSKDDFTKDDFDVDRFLQESCQKSGLHKLHKELGLYIKYLQSMIVDLVNNESNAIVNLSSDLKVLQNKFDNLSNPLGQLKEELMQVYRMIDTNLSNVKYLLNKKESIVSQKKCKLNELRMLVTSQKVGSILEAHINEDDVQMEIIERSVNQYIMQHMYSQLCNSESYNFRNTDTLFRTLNSVFLKSIQDLDGDKTTRCLQMFMLMNAQDISENLYRTDIVRPAFYGFINENVLDLHRGDLTIIYDKIIDFVNTNTNYLLLLMRRNHEITGFDFILRSVWLEASEQLKLNLNVIFAPGNPVVFQQRFKQTCHFLRDLEACFEGTEARQAFRRHESYRKHYLQWNLSVYFEIRFLEIVESIEKFLTEDISKETISEAAGDFRVLPFIHTWNAIKKCFFDDIFLPQLLDKFWKLTLQIISRLNVWINAILKVNVPLKQLSETLRHPDNIKIQFLTYLHVDVENFLRKLKGDLSFTNKGIPAVLIGKVRLSLDEFVLNAFPNNLIIIKTMIVEYIYNECSSHVKNVSQIPRLYRKTNRSSPTAPSGYVSAMSKPIDEFHFTYAQDLGLETLNALIKDVYVKISAEYSSLVSGVLTSVARTEESLRRLKKTRVGSDGTESSDDQKIRAQLQLDVHSYAEKAATYVDTVQLLNLVKDVSPPRES